jgi:isopenicillin N synthase-like dioxygenase
VPAFSAALRDYITACLTLGDQLLRGISLGLGLPERFFAGQLAGPEGSYWVARVIHYPPLQRVDQQQQGESTRVQHGNDCRAVGMTIRQNAATLLGVAAAHHSCCIALCESLN